MSLNLARMHVRRMFIGQGAGSKKGGRQAGMAQREQKAVLAEFREGAFNTLVATCIGEEGLDIPQVLLPQNLHAILANMTPSVFAPCLSLSHLAARTHPLE